jgi:parvulin-like peptidyl-prolyl isomerase
VKAEPGGQAPRSAPRARAARQGALAAAAAIALLRAAAGHGAAAPPGGAVARVGGEPIARAELDQRTAQALGDYHARSGTEVPAELRPVVRRQMLERLIQRQLLSLESRRVGVTISDAEAEKALRDDPFFKEGGVFNEAKFQVLRNANPAQFRNALEQARTALAARQLMQRASARAMPEERELRARATRGLERATFEYLALRRSEFDGTVPEPREDEIRAEYAAHAAEYRRPQRAVLTVLLVQQDLDEAVAGDPQRLAAWERGLRQRADSVLAVVRAGTSLEQVAKRLGGLKSRVVALPGNFPAYWRGDESQQRRVFTLKPGEILPEVVPSNPGWLVVRVDQSEPAHAARFEEVARELRARMRADRRTHRDDADLNAIFAAVRDSLAGPAYRARVAVVDTATIDPGEPDAAEIDRTYRAHLADYSTYDAERGAIVTRPLAEVRDELRGRWRQERRTALARARAEQILDLWSHGRRDSKVEAGARVREIGPLPMGASADTGRFGAAVTASLQARGASPGADLVNVPSGVAVCQLVETLASYTPNAEQARPVLLARLEARRAAEEERGARALYDRDPRAFAVGRLMHWSAISIDPPDFLTMKMTHREVEDYQRRHLERYSAPEIVHASHILVEPADGSSAADARARARADSLLARLKAGADFARLARENSDDEATRDDGGDLGEFGRGAMLPEFERAAFALQPGQMSGVVRSSAGYHIIRCHEHLATAVQPLVLMYTNVSADLAMEKADSAAARRADSLRRVTGTPARARAAANALHLPIIPIEAPVGQPAGGDRELDVFLRALEKLGPGQFYPGVYHAKGAGYQVCWMDSVTSPRTPTWDQAREAAINRYRHEGPDRALAAKRAELDSLAARGWSFDSLATLFGGAERAEDARLTTSLPLLGARDLDTLVFGTRAPARLKIGEASDWVTFPAGLARLRVLERAEPDPTQVEARLETERRLAEARALESFFAGLKRRYPVAILDADLRDTQLPTIPDR